MTTYEPVLFPDAAAAVIVQLAVTLPGYGYTAIHVGGRVPDPRPDRFVRVIRTGGARRNMVIDDALLAVEAWADTEQAAHDLAQYCRAVVNAMPDLGVVRAVEEVSGPGSLPDPDTDQSRFTQQFQVSTRGSAA